MDNIIFTLHPVTDAAWKVLQDPRNANLLVHVDAVSKDDDTSHGEVSALSLSLDRAPKTGSSFIIGRHNDADIVLTDPASSLQHCIVSISDKGVPWLHEQSTNGTLINGKYCNNQILEVQTGMQIDIRDAAFDIRVPWRGNWQQDYEYKARRVKESRAKTPIESLPTRSAPANTVWVETLGPYTSTNTLIESVKLASMEVGRTEIVRKGRSFFTAKRFNRKGFGQRELRAWQKINKHELQHPNIIHLEEVLNYQSGPVLIMELLPRGSFVEIFCERGVLVAHEIAVSVMRQLLSALEYLHELGIVHTAIRLDNLLVSTEQPICVKLTGFEFSSLAEASLSSMSVCPAPELWERYYRGGVAPLNWEKILTNRGYFEKRPMPLCGSPVDIWGAGVICSQLTLGKIPCYLDSGKSSDEQAADYVDLLLTARSESATERSEAWAQKLGLSLRLIPSSLLNFLQRLLDPEPESRANAEGCLTDSWLTQHAQDLTESVKPDLEEPVRKRQRLDSTSRE